jgi:hypothetical protein
MPLVELSTSESAVVVPFGAVVVSAVIVAFNFVQYALLNCSENAKEFVLCGSSNNLGVDDRVPSAFL